MTKFGQVRLGHQMTLAGDGVGWSLYSEVLGLEGRARDGGGVPVQ